MSWEQRNKDFSKAQADAQMAYIEAEREVKRLESENVKLREVLRSCVVLLTDHQFLHLPELLDETFKAMRELGIEVGE